MKSQSKKENKAVIQFIYEDFVWFLRNISEETYIPTFKTSQKDPKNNEKRTQKNSKRKQPEIS